MLPSGFLTTVVIAALAAGEPVSIQGAHGLGDTRRHTIESEHTAHRYDILVGLPDGYADRPDARYPVVYLLDGGMLYPLIRAYQRYLRIDGEVPPVILVAVSYGTSDWRQGNNRSHDFTLPSPDADHWGGAPDYRRFLEYELLPAIDAGYRTDPGQRVLFGQSLGGRFALYAAQTRPDLFQGYIASNPALHGNLDFFLTTRPESVSRAKVFVASGSEDDTEFGESGRQWIEYWTSLEEPPWQLAVHELTGHGHSSAPPAAYRAGMRWLFE